MDKDGWTMYAAYIEFVFVGGVFLYCQEINKSYKFVIIIVHIFTFYEKQKELLHSFNKYLISKQNSMPCLIKINICANLVSYLNFPF